MSRLATLDCREDCDEQMGFAIWIEGKEVQLTEGDPIGLGWWMEGIDGKSSEVNPSLGLQRLPSDSIQS